MQDDESKKPEEDATLPVAPQDSEATPAVEPSSDISAAAPPEAAAPATVSPPPKRSRKKLFIIAAMVVLVLLIGGAAAWAIHHHSAKPKTTSATSSKSTKSNSAPQTKTEGLMLDTSKNYGNKYADGIVPVGDGKYNSNSAKVGYIDACSGYANNIAAESGGAGKRGPWFTDNNTEYNITQKIHVNGSVLWSAEFTNTLSGATRTIVTNDLPNHPTGIFPIAASDPAYQYDKNPNSIKGQTYTYTLSAAPTYSSTPQCEGGQVGIMLTGVALFNGFDAAGRDAGAWEVQDSCDGHPQSDGEYHYHTLSACIKDTSVKTVIGYALDGFPITGPQVGTNNVLTTADLDECHGLTSQITLNGKTVTSYHYVMTQDFPYSISCFRGTPITPPGQQPAPH